MFTKSKQLILILALVGTVSSASAFSLMGPFTAWQTADLGYNPFGNAVGGPMNKDEEYRWNIKTIYYGYDESFWNFYGPAGTNAINGAIAILNALPPVSTMSTNLAEYPTDTTRPNYTAQALGIMDLKSYTLAALVEQMGLASPERYVWTLRGKVTPLTWSYYTVVKRNFDPVTWNYSSYVNGVLYNFAILDPVYGTVITFADAYEFRADGLSYGFNSVASGVDDDTIGNASLGVGYYYTGLTRDDVGGLRYLYLPTNIQYENLPVDAVGTVAYIPPNPWDPVGGGGTFVTNAVVDLALRGGVDKITFKQVRYDSLIGIGYFLVETNTYTDYYYTNGPGLKSQTIQRVVTQPDIVFQAEDMGLTGGGFPIQFTSTDTSGWVNNDAINGTSTLDGPGVIQSPMVFTYTKMGPYVYGLAGYYPAEGARAGLYASLNTFSSFIWGSFDGTTNAPIVFPQDISIPDLEWLVFQGSSGISSPWTVLQLNTTNTTTDGGIIGGGTRP